MFLYHQNLKNNTVQGRCIHLYSKRRFPETYLLSKNLVYGRKNTQSHRHGKKYKGRIICV